MRKVVYTTQVDKEKADTLRKYDNERVTRQNVVNSYISSGNDLTNPTYNQYHNELIEVTAKVDLLREEIYQEYVPDEYKGSNAHQWELDYFSGELRVVEV